MNNALAHRQSIGLTSCTTDVLREGKGERHDTNILVIRRDSEGDRKRERVREEMRE